MSIEKKIVIPGGKQYGIQLCHGSTFISIRLFGDRGRYNHGILYYTVFTINNDEIIQALGSSDEFSEFGDVSDADPDSFDRCFSFNYYIII